MDGSGDREIGRSGDREIGRSGDRQELEQIQVREVNLTRSWMAVVLTYMDVGNAGVVRSIHRPYTATIAMDGVNAENAGAVFCHSPHRKRCRPSRLHTRWRSAEQSRLC